MSAPRKNFNEAVALYNSGMSVEQVANLFCISRQSMHASLKRRGVVFRSNVKLSKDNHFYRGGPTRNASIIVKECIERGLLTIGPCEVCGVEPAIVNGVQRIQAHHDDYNKLLEVRWLCKKHHHEWHKTNKAKPRTTPMKTRSEVGRLGGLACWSKNRILSEANLSKARSSKKQL